LTHTLIFGKLGVVRHQVSRNSRPLVAGVAFSGARFPSRNGWNNARRISAQCGILGENLVAGKREQRNILRVAPRCGLSRCRNSVVRNPTDFITAPRCRASGEHADEKPRRADARAGVSCSCASLGFPQRAFLCAPCRRCGPKCSTARTARDRSPCHSCAATRHDFAPLRLLIGIWLRVFDDVGGMGWLVHVLLLLL
jgi:hypothetical protein